MARETRSSGLAFSALVQRFGTLTIRNSAAHPSMRLTKVSHANDQNRIGTGSMSPLLPIVASLTARPQHLRSAGSDRTTALRLPQGAGRTASRNAPAAPVAPARSAAGCSASRIIAPATIAERPIETNIGVGLR